MALPPKSQPSNTTDNIVLINGYEYTYDLMYYNGDIVVRIPNHMIHELSIIDSIYSIFHYGHLVIKNDFNILENYTSPDVPSADETVLNTSIFFKGNVASDVIVVRIKPMRPLFNDNSLSDEDWGLNFFFSVYDEDELHNPTSTEKLKILFLRDIREDILSNTYLPWSTTDVLVKENQTKFNINQLSNAARSVKTGRAIQHILTDTLVDFKGTFDVDWDLGNTSIFYSLPYDQTRFDALEYLLDHHVAINTADNCLLKCERGNVWTLLPLEKYFQRALDKANKLPGDFTIDLFHLHMQQNQEEGTTSKIPPKSKCAYDQRIAFDYFAGLSNFSYSNITNKDSSAELVTTPVSYSNIGEKQFGVDIKGNTITEAQDTFQSLYVDKMHGEPPLNTIPVSPAKVQHYLYNPVYSVHETKTQRQKEGRNRIMAKALGYSNGVTFNVEGLTVRRSGRFISIINTGQFPETAFQNIIQGEWFITQVTHTFIGTTYRNEVTCIKPYAYKKLS